MKRKFKLMVLLLAITICLGIMSNTYSRYVASAKGNINASFSKWQILVDNTDITNGNESTISITPTIEENGHVAPNAIAPSSIGYFDINIDPTNVDVSFNYNIELLMNNKSIKDLVITKYAILGNDYVEGDTLEYVDLIDGKINNEMLYNKENTSFKFNTFTIRIYFEWYDGADKEMTDEEDTQVGLLAANEEVTFNIDAQISFEQIIQ